MNNFPWENVEWWGMDVAPQDGTTIVLKVPTGWPGEWSAEPAFFMGGRWNRLTDYLFPEDWERALEPLSWTHLPARHFPIESAPKDGTTVLGFDCGWFPMRWEGDRWELAGVTWPDESVHAHPTRWMPRPPEPKR